MIVVSDTSPLTSLITIGRADVLPSLFETVCVPEAVRDELVRGHGQLPSFLRVDTVRDRHHVERLLGALDLGEAEAIVLAQELHADVLLMDERAGREIAVREGVRVVGLMGVLLAAKRQGLIPSIRVVADELRRLANFRVADSVLHAVLHEAGEG
jgi:predicted nucleic acid-binding protein